MAYAKIVNSHIAEYPLTQSDIISKHPNTSFPVPFELPDGYAMVHNTIPPEPGPLQTVREVGPRFEDGQWYQCWSIDEISDEEMAVKREYMAATARNARNMLLAETDWTQGKDIPDSVSIKWAPYRQALRDVTLQDDFPFEVLWPEKPINNNQHS